MCLIVFGLNVHPAYQLILAANRDEFYERPTDPAAFWNDEPEILAGRDKVHGGTWLGVTKTGRFAAVTNFRDPTARDGTGSRGQLTLEFLKGNESAEKYLLRVGDRKGDYSEFNLLAGNFAGAKSELFYLSNRGLGPEALPPGIYGLSNGLLDAPWPKVDRAKMGLEKSLRRERIKCTDLTSILADQTLADDEDLPDTGIGIQLERALSSAFVRTAGYGTVSSTVLTIDRAGTLEFREETSAGVAGAVHRKFRIV